MVKLSRSKIELFLDCPRCFWLDIKQGIKRPQPPPYTINNAVDYLLKQEFDIHREKGTPHPIMKKHKVEAVPYKHEDIHKWRQNFIGVQYHHKPTDFLVFGAVDDIWVNPNGELIVVDYKATGAKEHQIYDSYKRQMEIYQWLLRGNGFRVADLGYFVFARVNKGDGFTDALRQGLRVSLSRTPQGDGSAIAALSFDMFVELQKGDASWVESVLASAREVYDSYETPRASGACKYCMYREAAEDF